MLELGIIASGSGSNAQAILDAVAEGRLDARVRVVVSNKPGAGVLERAKQAGVPAVCLDHREFEHREDFDTALIGVLQMYGVDTVAMAGFMRLITPVFLDAFPNRVLNIHPALLPAFPGTHGVADALAYGVKLAGCTVHFVSAVMDSGPIIIQAAVAVRDKESVNALQKRILETCEHRIYPQALQWLAQDRLRLEGRTVRLLDRRKPDLAPRPVGDALISPPLEI